ncbi:hypothetical protein HY621_03090 [Candidatus Uhrbacteria bacterium]|nr:hypothetical protein [Candidatus Uhrbacteria bacterium]
MRGQAIKFFIFFFVAIFFVHAVQVQGADKGVDIGGWAWNGSLGWVSQRDVISDPEAGERKGTFGVVKYDKDSNGKEKAGDDFIEGWSWSSLYGFMCWGDTCETLCTREQLGTPACALSPSDKDNLGGSSDPPGASVKPLATITKKTIVVEDVPIKGKPQKKKLNIVNGWAKVLTMKEQGWVSLNGCTAVFDENDKCPKGKEYGLYFDPDTQEFRGWAWSNFFGWLAFSGKTLYDTPYEFVENSEDKEERYEVRGNEVITQIGSCPVPLVAEKCLLSAVLELSNFKLVKGAACLTPGLCEDVGFSEKLGKSAWRTQYVGPWVQTKGGTKTQTNVGTTIFSRKGFDLAQSSGFVAEQKYSGVYDQEYEEGGEKKKRLRVRGSVPVTVRCDILSDESGKEICREAGKKRLPIDLDDNPDVRAGALLLEFPKESKTDTQKLVGGLNTLQKKVFTTLPVRGELNIYGYKVKRITSELDILAAVTAGLKNTIYVYDVSRDSNPQPLMIGSNTLRNSIQFNNGQPSGAGTIVAYGADIQIYRPLTYEKSAVNNLTHLASIAWIALKDGKKQGGNIIFDNCIPPVITPKTYAVPLAGLFFAEGEIRTGTGKGEDCIKDAEIPTDVKNKFRGGFSSLDAPITVEGIMVAAKFLLQRVYGGADQGSELILDTGRAHINPPPGIEDIIRSLPFK